VESEKSVGSWVETLQIPRSTPTLANIRIEEKENGGKGEKRVLRIADLL
jgi:hypothetical protein